MVDLERQSHCATIVCRYSRDMTPTSDRRNALALTTRIGWTPLPAPFPLPYSPCRLILTASLRLVGVSHRQQSCHSVTWVCCQLFLFGAQLTLFQRRDVNAEMEGVASPRSVNGPTRGQAGERENETVPVVKINSTDKLSIFVRIAGWQWSEKQLSVCRQLEVICGITATFVTVETYHCNIKRVSERFRKDSVKELRCS